MAVGYTEIIQNLFQGGIADQPPHVPEEQTVSIPEGFDLVIWIPRAAPPAYSGKVIAEFFDDIPELPDMEIVKRFVDESIAALRAGGKVLVLCRMGHNRSSLVTSAILKRLGWSGDVIVDLIRGKRAPSLSNAVFEAWVRSKETV